MRISCSTLESATAPLPLEGIVAVKALAHWLTTGLPLVVFAPVLGLLLHLPGPAYGWLVVSLALGTPALSVLGAFGAAVTVGLRRGGLLLSLLVLPLYVPTLIFGAEAVRREVDSVFGPQSLGGFAPGGVRDGHMPGSTHYDGRAVDIFFRPVTEASRTRGWAVASYLVAQAERLAIQRGLSMLYPASTISAHVSASPNHQTGRSFALGYRCDVSLPYVFGVELDPRALSEQDERQLAERMGPRIQALWERHFAGGGLLLSAGTPRLAWPRLFTGVFPLRVTAGDAPD